MLKGLELFGFKSFADRARFEFPRGTTVVVGPNGSGKSNIVDAVKWVLGSQSAKSLRGQEMADVIFNGSAARGPMGAAEATLTLDNANGALAIDAREVHITRRVYRSGEAEYLINRQPCRLRDIRDLLNGTGITTEAYCIIEQGKVDALLQASPRERRVIFEEAAGISQFKTKKTIALRRLERVDHNLLRLSDIVDEVESRVRSVRSQAGKARRYRDWATRLQELRTQIGLADWRALTEEIAARDRELNTVRQRQRERETSVERCEAQVQDVERALESSAERQRAIDAELTTSREQIAARQAGLESQLARRTELQQEIDRYRRQLVAMTSRAGDKQQQMREVAAEYQAAERDLSEIGTIAKQQSELAQQAQVKIEGLRGALDRCEAQLLSLDQSSAQLANQMASWRAEQAAALAESQRLEQTSFTLDEQHRAEHAELARDEQAAAELVVHIQECESTHAGLERVLLQLRDEQIRAETQRRQLESRLARTKERISVLAELEERLEGFGGGIQHFLTTVRSSPDWGPIGIYGVVADLFHVDVDTAAMLEVALGERAQFLVVQNSDALFERLRLEPLRVADRIGFLQLDTRTAQNALDHIDLAAEPGVIGRADQFVETDSAFTSLAQRLLGRTWLVDRLATALRLAAAAGRGLSFVTGDGELLSSDGSLVIGPRSSAVGILSRRSELRACREQEHALDRQLVGHNGACARLVDEIARQEQSTAASRKKLDELKAQQAERREQLTAARVRHAMIEQARQRNLEQLRKASDQLASTAEKLQTAVEQQKGIERKTSELRSQSEAHRKDFDAADRQLAELTAVATERQVAAARCEQRVEMLRHQLEQAARDQEEKERALQETRQRLSARDEQLAQQEASMLASRQALAELFLAKEAHAKRLAEQAAGDESLRRKRADLNARMREERQQLAASQAQRHKLEVGADRLRHERQTIRQRLQDDYNIDLVVLAADGSAVTEAAAPVTTATASPGGIPPDRDAIEQEIAELRNQIASLGAVNVDALEELDGLESRFNHLSEQRRDLVDGKAALERIIHQIDGDGRKLFVATLESVRTHFKELFRRLFGGGEADIVLDSKEDVLDGGIDIIARPPGKEACSISLLSGGEKTLTCVALLLAVFRSKPSPFCILDEVDAALDESNIGRFVDVIRDFLSFTQFIVVTHSKKTMTGGDTLYGVTMEESGVSKRVAVRFEDVSEDGQIRLSQRRAA